MIKYVALVIVIMLCAPVKAKEYTIIPHYDTGYYSALGLGIGFGRFKYEETSFPWNKDTKQSDAFSITYGLGYQRRFDEKLLVGFQGVLNYHDHSLGKENYRTDLLSKVPCKVHSEYSYGIEGIAGFIHGPFMVYGKVGVEFAPISHKKSLFKRGSIKQSFCEVWQDKQSHVHTGLSIGLGCSYSISDTASLGCEVKHVFYNAKQYTHYRNTTDAVTYNIQPKVTRLMATMMCRL